MGPQPEQVQRLEVVGRAAALAWRTDPVLVPSDSNDTWLIDERSRGPAVLRIAWRGDRGRLITEAKVGRALPESVGYPSVLGFGWTRDEADLTWSLTRRLTGQPLAEVWPELSDAQRDDACRTLARRVGELHAWRPSGAVSDRLLAWPDSSTAAGVVGATLLPLPLRRVRVLVAEVGSLTGVDPGLVRRACAWLDEHQHLGPTLDRPGLAVTHQDLHLANAWWDGRGVSALLDLEWVRLAEPWTDLHRVADNVDEDRGRGSDAHAQLLAALLRELPRLNVVGLSDRLRFCRIAFQVRQLFTWPTPADPPPDHHPVRVLQELLG